MPRTSITITETSRTGVNQPSQQTADNSNGMKLDYNDGQILLELAASTGTVTFTFPIPGTVDTQAVASRTVSVSSTPKLVGPFPNGVYNQPDGTLNVDIDSANGRLRAYHLGR
jgi:hypothetical protein